MDPSLLVPLQFNPSDEDWNTWMNNLYFSMKTLGQSGNEQLTGAFIATLAQMPGAFSSLPNFGDDASAGAGGVPIGALYRRGNVLCVRVV